MAELAWVTKTRRKGTENADVLLGVSSVSRKRKTPMVYFTFYSNAFEKFTDTEYAVFAVKGNKIYFNSAEMNQGYKLSKASANTNVMQVPVNKNLHTALGQHTGSYVMFKDRELGLYYIELR